MSARQISTPSQSEAELQIRQLVRQTSRDGLGVFISGILATHLPWLLIPAVYNVYGFLTNLSLLRSLQKLFRRKGIPVRKRVIAKGIIEGVQTKLLSSVLTIGHGEFIDGTGAVASWLKSAGNYISSHVAPLPSSWTFSASSLQSWDEQHRMSLSLIKQTTDLASKPVQVAQEATGTAAQSSLKWHEDGESLAKQVLIVGTVQLASEKVAEQVIEKSYDRAKDPSDDRRRRDRLRSWWQRWV